MRFAEEMEALAKARGDRIGFLVSEVRRLKGCLGARNGSAEYLAFLRGDGGIDGDYVKNLESRLTEAEGKLKTLEGSSGAVEVKGEANTAVEDTGGMQEISPGKSEEDKEFVGRLPVVDKQSSGLAMQLSEAEAVGHFVIRSGRLTFQATNALYAEVEGLSKLWEGLEQSVTSKVFDLKDGELKMARLSTEVSLKFNVYVRTHL
jgi:E3 ubiquitin-protein ligase BRE1